MSDAAATPHDAPHTMQCMEVWGGFGVSDNGVVMPGLDVWVFSIPYQGAEAGGDVHYVSSCGTGRISRLLVADVSGHGTSVAAIARELRDLMRRYVNYIDQRAFVERLNGAFVELTKSGLFATAAVATFFAPTRTLTVTNAGHPRPLLYSAARGAWRLMSEEAGADAQGLANLPLGMFEETLYPNVMLQAGKGDVVVIYSDSLIEAPLEQLPGDKPGRLLGVDGLLETARGVPIEPAQTFA
ncbi:MAG TPA: PP2C family protein-serine/threonine phosphatase, partial [Phycisphaerales bacterium]|nr:PP2C family protein-serine/threonine phosphatase [Phycisphaerales bacterium]